MARPQRLAIGALCASELATLALHRDEVLVLFEQSAPALGGALLSVMGIAALAGLAAVIVPGAKAKA